MKKIAGLTNNPLAVFIVSDRIHGTVLKNLSLLKASDLLDAYSYYERTGVNTMSTDEKIKVLVAWKNLAQAVGLKAEDKKSFTASEKKEMIAEFGRRLDSWIEGSSSISKNEEPLD